MAIIVRDIEQGSEEWHRLRLGIPSASNFHRIITPAKGEPSRQAIGYRRELLAEWLTGAPSGPKQNYWMQRGTELEAEARAYYEMYAGCEVEHVGFVWQDDDNTVGCSPDGLVGDDGGVEIKCPAPATHVGYILDQKIPTDYIPQVQGSLWVTGRTWWDFVSYSPGLEPLVIRVERDNEYISNLKDSVNKFVRALLEEQITLIEKGYQPCRTGIT